MQNKSLKMGLLVLALLAILPGAGCKGAFNRFTLLLHGSYEVSTPYITPIARGTSHLLITPFPRGTPVFDREKCLTPAGKAYIKESLPLYWEFEALRGGVGKTKREDLPPTIDEMRQIHDKFQALDPPADCEILVVLGYHIQAEMDQTIRALVTFRNLDPEEVMMDYFNEASFHKRTAEGLMARID